MRIVIFRLYDCGCKYESSTHWEFEDCDKFPSFHELFKEEELCKLVAPSEVAIITKNHTSVFSSSYFDRRWQYRDDLWNEAWKKRLI